MGYTGRRSAAAVDGTGFRFAVAAVAVHRVHAAVGISAGAISAYRPPAISSSAAAVAIVIDAFVAVVVQ